MLAEHLDHHLIESHHRLFFPGRQYWPEIETQKYIFNPPKSQPQPDPSYIPRIPEIICCFQEDRQSIWSWSVSRSRLLLPLQVQPPRHAIGLLGGSQIHYKVFQNF